MRLHRRHWGEGGRTALLVHGLSADGSAWWRVGPALAERGYRVTAVDLRGHGLSPRAGYSPELFASDLKENSPASPDLVLGHSLGGLALALAVGAIKPKRAIYVEPGWRFDEDAAVGLAEYFRGVPSLRKEDLRRFSPRWHERDVDEYWKATRRFDPGCVEGILGRGALDLMPRFARVASLVMTADPSELVPPSQVAELQAGGFEVVAVQGAGHSIFRDDFDAFMRSLDAWSR